MKKSKAKSAAFPMLALMRTVRLTGLFFVLWMLCGPTSFAQTADNDDGGPTYESEVKDGPVINSAGGGSGVCRAPLAFETAKGGSALLAGTIITNQLDGVTVSVDAGNTSSGQARKAMIYDANCSGADCSGGDADLATAPGYHPSNTTPLGNVLIISEDNDSGDPDDNASGGWFIFDFDTDVELKSLTFLDIDSGEYVVVRLFDSSGHLFYDQTTNGIGDNAVMTVPVNRSGARRMKVRLRNSGALAQITYCDLADLEVYLSAGSGPANAGDPIIFSTDVINNRKDGDPFGNRFGGSEGILWPNTTTATNITATVSITNELKFVSASCPSPCSVSSVPASSTGGTVVFSIPSLAPGTSISLTVETEVTSQGFATATAEIDSVNQTDPDSSPGNCSGTGAWFFITPLAPAEDDCFSTGIGVLPVELVAFQAITDGRAVTLQWKTSSETNNAGFEVQHRYLGATEKSTAPFEVLSWVDGAGTTEQAQDYSFRVDGLEPGRHTFRLKQIDYDGTFEYSPEVEVAVEMPEAFLVTPAYPNPFNPQAGFSFGVLHRQQVAVEVFDLLGRRVAELYRGTPEAGTTQTLRIDGSGWPSGLYMVRVLGERFVHTQTVTLLK